MPAAQFVWQTAGTARATYCLLMNYPIRGSRLDEVPRIVTARRSGYRTRQAGRNTGQPVQKGTGHAVCNCKHCGATLKL